MDKIKHGGSMFYSWNIGLEQILFHCTLGYLASPLNWLLLCPQNHDPKYYETDQMGIIHHSNYIKWMEEARMDLMDQIGLSYKQMEEMEIISPVLSVSCEYHSMVHFDDTVVIETKITRYNGIKMDVEYRMTDKETGELRTTGKSSHCFLNRSGRPISLKRSYPEIDTKFFEYTDA